MAQHEDVELRVGHEHSVALEGLMTAGYVWRPEVVGDESVAAVSKADAALEDQPEAIGAGPPEVFTIKALRPGTTRLRFTQGREWDPADTADERIVDVRVTD